MLISIGSRSKPKITAITRAFSRYPEIWMKNDDKIEFLIIGRDVKDDEKKGQEKDSFSGVSCNPLSLEETINGAKNRAKKAFEYANQKDKCNFGVGIEARNVFCSRSRNKVYGYKYRSYL